VLPLTVKLPDRLYDIPKMQALLLLCYIPPSLR
jgi:hypothetical protein